MKKIISTLLVLAMVLTMALTVSAHDEGDTELVVGDNTLIFPTYEAVWCYYKATVSGTVTVNTTKADAHIFDASSYAVPEFTLPYSRELNAGEELWMQIITETSQDGDADTMTLTVSFEASAGGGATATAPADVLNGTYDTMFYESIKMHSVTFTPASAGATNGTLTVTGEDSQPNAVAADGTYDYAYNATTGKIDVTGSVAFDLTLGTDGKIIGSIGSVASLTFVKATTQGGGGAAPADPILAMLDGAYCVTDLTQTEYYNVVFTPASEGATNGTVTVIDNNNTGASDVDVSGTYTYTYDAATGAITLNTNNVIISAMDLGGVMLTFQATEFAGMRELVVDNTPPTIGGGNNDGDNGGAPKNGDNVALYVAVGAVALASIFGCAIVSKKRVTE